MTGWATSPATGYWSRPPAGSRRSHLCSRGGFVARIGGDKFVMLVDDPAAAEMVAQAVLDDLARPFQTADLPNGMGATIGISLSR